MEMDCWKQKPHSLDTKSKKECLISLNVQNHSDETEMNSEGETFVSNNVFLNSVAVPNLSCDPIEDEERYEARGDKDMSQTEGSRFEDQNNNNDNDDERELGEYSLDDSFIKMIDNTYKEMSLVITPADNENTLTNIKTEIKEENVASAGVGFVPPPLAESSPKKIFVDGSKSNKKLLSSGFNFSQNLQQSNELLKQCDELLSGFETQFLTKTKVNKEQGIKRRNSSNSQGKFSFKFQRILPKQTKSCTPKLVSVLKPQPKWQNIQPKLTIENYFANFSPDETTIRKIDRIPPPKEPGETRSEFRSPAIAPITPRFTAFGHCRPRIMKPSFMVPSQLQKHEKERQRRHEFSIYRNMLKSLLPTTTLNDKMSTLTVLSEARHYCNLLNREFNDLELKLHLERKKNSQLVTILHNYH